MAGKWYDDFTDFLITCSFQALFLVQIFGFVFGIVSAFSPEYYTLLLFRGLVGFGLGGGFLGCGISRVLVCCIIYLDQRIVWSFYQLVAELL